VPFAPPPRPSWPRAFLFGAIAASLIFVTLAASLFVLWRRNNALRAELAGLSQRLNETQQELAVVREENMMLASPDTRTALLAGTQMAPQARARLTIDKQTGRAMLSVYNLPPAPEGKAYQLWFIADGRVMPGKVFKPDAQGSVLMHEEVPAAARLTAVFAVTLEPQGGVQSPTGEKYLLGSSAALQGA
jgi:hypothetical protein